MRGVIRSRTFTSGALLAAALVLMAWWAAAAMAVDPGYPFWTRTWAAAGDQDFTEVAGCPNGDILVAGHTDQTIRHAVVARYSPNGARRWVKVLDAAGADEDTVTELLSDGDGNAVLACKRALNGGGSLYLVSKYSPTGRLVWKRTLQGGQGGSNYVNDLALNAAGDAYVTGRATFTGDVAGSLTARLRARDGKVVMHCELSGAHSLAMGNSLAVDSAGAVYVTGTGDRGDGTDEMVTVKIRAGGTVAWTAEAAGAGTARVGGRELALGKGGSLYATGTTTPSGPVVVVKYSTAGGQQWRDDADIPLGHIDAVECAQTDRLGNLFVAGYSQSGGPSPSQAFVARWTPGKTRWVCVRPSGTVSTRYQGLVPDQSGGCWTGGLYVHASGTTDAKGVLYSARVTRSGGLKWEQVQMRAGEYDQYTLEIAPCGGGLAMVGYVRDRVGSQTDAVVAKMHR